MTEKSCTNLEFLSRDAGKSAKFWNWIRKRLENHDDFSIVCPTLERARELIKQMRKLVIELNSKSKIKITHPFEKMSDGYKHKTENDKTPD